MKRIDLIEVKHNRKIGDECEYIEPNVTEDCIFYADGEPIGFYLTKMPEKMCKLADLANEEFMSKNVKKEGRLGAGSKSVSGNKERPVMEGCSTILGSVPPKPYIGRPFASISSRHNDKKSKTFIKAMLLLAKESEQLIKELLPKQHEKQIELFKNINDKWKFGNLFTSSVSNLNVPVNFHIDKANIEGCVNVIICKQKNAKGGDLHIPDYNATIGQVDNSILVYPAWRNMHGVTPIIPTFKDGYRNSLVFYPLKAFIGLDK
jgi:hypothetical protein